jgi:ankyrin repeat protein
MNYPTEKNILKLIETNSDDLNKIMSSGNTPLVEAIINNDYPTVQLLLKNDKVDINFEYKMLGHHNIYALKACLGQMDEPGYLNFKSGLKDVHNSEYEPIFNLLINNKKLKKKHILYDIFFLETRIEDIEKIIKNLNIDLNEKDEDGNTVLMKVLMMYDVPYRPVGQNTVEYSKFLVSKGAILDIKNNKNEDCYSIIDNLRISSDEKVKLKNDLILMTIKGKKVFRPTDIFENISSLLIPKKDGRKSSKRKLSKRKLSKRKSSKRKLSKRKLSKRKLSKRKSSTSF